jgi:hypothetical protein
MHSLLLHTRELAQRTFQLFLSRFSCFPHPLFSPSCRCSLRRLTLPTLFLLLTFFLFFSLKADFAKALACFTTSFSTSAYTFFTTALYYRCSLRRPTLTALTSPTLSWTAVYTYIHIYIHIYIYTYIYICIYMYI